MSPTVHVVFRLALQMGSTGESEDSCASVGEIIPNGSSSEIKRIAMMEYVRVAHAGSLAMEIGDACRG